MQNVRFTRMCFHTFSNGNTHGNDAHSYQSSSAFGIWEAQPDVMQAAQPTVNQIAVSLCLLEMQILSAVNDVTSGHLWFLWKIRLIMLRTCKISTVCLTMSNCMSARGRTSHFLSVADYADDIHQHVRKGDVSNCCYLLLSSTLSHFCSFDLLNFFLKSVIAVIWYWAL